MNKLINILLEIEEELIKVALQKHFQFQENLEAHNQDEIKAVNANLLLTGQENIAFVTHRDFINLLIHYYLKNTFPNKIELFKTVFIEQYEDYRVCENIEVKNIPSVIEELHVAFLNSKFSISANKLLRSKSKHYLKEFGAVYTLKSITKEIVSKTIQKSLSTVQTSTLKCLDFASGTGRFYFEAVEILQRDYGVELIHIISNNLYAVDVDDNAINILKLKVISMLTETEISEDVINAISKNIIHRNALIPDTSLIPNFDNSINFNEDFKNVFESGGFDAVFSNPPYYLLKVNKSDNKLLEEYFTNLQLKVKNEINFFKNSGFYQYSIEGMLNYYQLSIEMIIRMTNKNGQIGIICPASIFADLTSTKLRKHLLNMHKLYFIRYYPEASYLFDNVAQSTVIFYLEKGGITDDINIELDTNNFVISNDVIKKSFDKNCEIPLIDRIGWNILEKLSKYPKLKEYGFIRNKRGELDLTQYKDCIINENSNYRLVRGNMITENGVVDKNDEYIDIDNFISKKSLSYRENDFNRRRLICQQISNIDSKRRMKFTFCESSDVLANSCNYINSLRSSEDLEKLYYLLNSSLLNWRFKITSSNNHINNYELDELPIIDLDYIDLESLNKNKEVIDALICQLYGLNQEEIGYVLGSNGKVKKTKSIENAVTI